MQLPLKPRKVLYNFGHISSSASNRLWCMSPPQRKAKTIRMQFSCVTVHMLDLTCKALPCVRTSWNYFKTGQRSDRHLLISTFKSYFHCFLGACTCTGEHWPVDADGAEVEDGGGAQHHVHGHQTVTEGGAEGPHAVLELKHTETRSVRSLTLNINIQTVWTYTYKHRVTKYIYLSTVLKCNF